MTSFLIGTGIAFWCMILMIGLYFTIDILLWKLVDILIKRWNLQDDLLAYMKHRYEKKRRDNYKS